MRHTISYVTIYRMKQFIPGYLKISDSKMHKMKQELFERLKSCTICPRLCRVNRLKNELGFCKTGRFVNISSYNLHFGEEKELVGTNGSGTIFFSFCNLECIYCQNYTISHLGEGSKVGVAELSSIMLRLQRAGAHNINFVTPTHILPQIIEALIMAKDNGLTIPLVYNSGGYDSQEVLELAEGIFDIYMPDAKYSDNSTALRYSLVNDYWQVCKKALIKMHRQVGDLTVDDRGIAQRGLLIRHLVLPNNVAGSFKILDFIAESISLNTYVNIMDQYRPCCKACNFREISRPITSQEYEDVTRYAAGIGLRRGFHLA